MNLVLVGVLLLPFLDMAMQSTLSTAGSQWKVELSRDWDVSSIAIDIIEMLSRAAREGPRAVSNPCARTAVSFAIVSSQL